MISGIWLLLALLLAAPAVASADAEEIVRQTSDQMLTELKERKQELQASPSKIYALVEHIVLPRFDFERMSRLVLGKHWPRASEGEQEAFVRVFRELLVRTYATALLNYSGQEIVYLPSHKAADGKEVTVNTKVQATGAPAIPINYRLYLNGKEWQVYDLSIDGVSLVSNYRSTFSSQIKRYKLSGLIERLEKRNQPGS
jgi:phospholipid transport system substrate-binding protein